MGDGAADVTNNNVERCIRKGGHGVQPHILTTIQKMHTTSTIILAPRTLITHQDGSDAMPDGEEGDVQRRVGPHN